MGLAAAFVFAAQMLNFPIAGGTSGHLLGSVLIAVLLGPGAAVLVLTAVLIVQCLVFADGGLSVLGANILNMAVLGAGVGGLIWKRLATAAPEHKLGMLGLASWVSVLIASFACSVELAAAGTIPFSQVAPAMLGMHALIGIGEAAMTAAVISLVAIPALRTTERRPVFALAISAAIIALAVAPFACKWPDGLESVASALNFLHRSAPTFAAPLPDYTIPAWNGMLSTSLAGEIGVALAFLAAWGLAKTWHRCPAKK